MAQGSVTMQQAGRGSETEPLVRQFQLRHDILKARGPILVLIVRDSWHASEILLASARSVLISGAAYMPLSSGILVFSTRHGLAQH
jgi:hypothetical protein